MKISVCLATYNGSRYLEAQIASIVPQLLEGDEIVVADDGSTDDTMALLDRFGPPLRVVGHDRVGGVVRNFERVLASALGEGLVLCDQDDIWLPGRLNTLRQALEHCSLVLVNGQVVDEQLQPRGKTIFELVGMKPGFWPNLARNSFIGCCMAFRRELRDRVLPFPAGVPWHDWYIGLVAEWIGKVERIDTVTLLYRRHGANFSPTGDKSNNSLWHKLAMRVFVLRAVLIAGLRQSFRAAS